MNLLAQSINTRILNLLPEDLLRNRLESLLQDVRKRGNVLKCRCPFHTESTFPSFQVHLARHAAFCTVHRCPAAIEMDLIELLAALQKKTPQLTLLQLLADAAITLEAQDRWDLDDYVAAAIEDSAKANNLEEARELLQLYSTLAPRNTELHLIAARLDRLEGLEESIERFRLVAEQSLEQGEILLAREAVGELEKTVPDDPALLLLRARQAEYCGDRRRAAEHYLKYLEQNQGAGLNGSAEELCERILHLDPSLRGVREQLARIKEENNQFEAARSHWEWLIKYHRWCNELDRALEISAHLIELNPAETALLESHAQLLLNAERRDEALRVYEELLQRASDEPNWIVAERYCRQLIDLKPDRYDFQERMIEILECLERPDRACFHAEKLLAQLEHEEFSGRAGEPERRRRLLKKIIDWQPERSAPREKYIRLLEKSDGADELWREYLALARLYFKLGLKAEATARLKKAQLAPNAGVEAQLAIAELYETQKLPELAAKALESAGRALCGENPRRALELCERGLALCPGHPGLLVLQIEIYRVQNDQEKILEILSRLTSTGESSGVRFGADKIRALVREYPDTLAFRMLLADVLIEEKSYDQAVHEIRHYIPRAGSDADRRHAVQSLSRIISQTQERADLLELKADLYRALNDTENHIETLRHLLRLNRQLGEIHAAAGIYDDLCRLAPDDTALLEERARYIEANFSSERALPDYQQLAERYRLLDQIEPYTETIRHLIQIDPSNRKRMRELADYLARKNRWQQAKQEYQLFIESLRVHKPGDPQICECLELILRHDPDDVAALRDLAGELERHDRVQAADLYSRAAGIHAGREEFAATVELLRKALACLGRGDAPLLLRLSEAYGRLEDFENERAAGEQALELQVAGRKFEDALNTLERLLQHHSADEELQLRRLDLLTQLDRPEEALGSYEQLIALAGLADDRERALQLRRRAAEQFPRRLEVREPLLQLLLELDQPQQARAEWLELEQWLSEDGRADEALRLLAPLLAVLKNDEELILKKIDLLLVCGAGDEAVLEYQLYSNALFDADRPEDAVRVQRGAAERFPERCELRHELIRLLVRARQIENAMQESLLLERQLREQSRFEEALDYLNQLAELLPPREELELRRIELLRELGRDDEALRAFKQLAAKLFDAGEAESAVRVSRAACAGFPQHRDVHDALIALLARLGRIQDAKSAFTELEQQLRSAERLAEALESLDLLIELLPEEDDLILRHIDLLCELGRDDEAREVYHRFTESLFAAGNAATAIEILRQAVQRFPQRRDIHDDLIALLVKAGAEQQARAEYQALEDRFRGEGRLDEALLSLAQLIQLLPRKEELELRRFQLLTEMGRPDEACAEFSRYANTLAEAGDIKAAIRIRNLQIKQFPENREVREELIQLLVNSKKPDQARKEYLNLTNWLEQAQRFGEAVEVLKNWRQFDARDWQLTERIAVLLLKEGQPAAAADEYSRAIQGYEAAADYDNAIRVAAAVLDIQPGRVDLKQRVAHWRHQLGQPELACSLMFECLAELLEAQDADESAAAIATLRGWLHKDDPRRAELAALLDQHGQERTAEDIYLELARVLFDQQDYARTIEVCAGGLQSRPARRALYAYQADAWKCTGDPRRAAETLRDLARQCAAENDRDAVIEAYGHACRLDEDALEIYEEYTKFLEAEELHDQALIPLRHLIEKYSARDNRDAEIACRRRLAGLQPDDLENRYVLAGLLFQSDNAEEAERRMRELLNSAFEAGEDQLAGAVLRELRARKPDDEELLLREIEYCRLVKDAPATDRLRRELGRLYQRQHREDEAVAVYRELLAEQPADQELFDTVAEILQTTGELQKYTALLLERCAYEEQQRRWERVDALRRRVREVQPDDLANLNGLAVNCLKLKQPQQAIELYSRVMDLQTNENSLQEAIQTGGRILAIDPHHRQARENLADLYELCNAGKQAYDVLEAVAVHLLESGQTDEALAFQSGLTKRFPELIEPLHRLADWLEQQDRRPEALEQLFRVLDLLLKQQAAAAALDQLESRMLQCCGDDGALLADVPRVLLERGQQRRAEQLLIRLIDAAEEQQAFERLEQLCARAFELCPQSTDVLRAIYEQRKARQQLVEAIECGLALGAQLHQNGKLDQAESLYCELIALNEQEPRGHEALIEFLKVQGRKNEMVEQINALSEIYLARADYTETLKCCNRILKVNKDDEPVALRKVDCLFKLNETPKAVKTLLDLSRKHEKEENFSRAVELLEQALERVPEDAGILRRLVSVTEHRPAEEIALKYKLRLAGVYESMGNLDKALKLLEELLVHWPDRLDVYDEIIDLAMQKGDAKLSVKTLLRLCARHEAQGDLERAIETRLRLQSFEPDNYDNLLALAELYQQHHDVEKALRHYKACFDLLKEQKAFQSAIDLAHQMLALDENQFELRRQTAQLYERVKQKSHAADEWSELAQRMLQAGEEEHRGQIIEALRQTVRNDSSRVIDHELLAELLARNEEIDGAIHEYNALIQYYEENELLNEAIANCLQILSLRPEDLQSHERLFIFYRNLQETRLQIAEALWLGRYHLQANQLIQAEEYWMQALETEPHNVEIKENLCELYELQDRKAEAVTLLFELGGLAREAGDQAGQLKYLDQAVRLQPERTELRRQQIDLRLEFKDTERARGFLQKWIRDLLTLGDEQELERTLETYLDAFTLDREFRLETAELLARNDRLALAAGIYLEDAQEQALARSWERVLDVCKLLLPLRQQPIKTYELYAQALEESDGDQLLRAEIYPQLGNLYRESGQWQQAIAVYRKWIDRDADQLDARQALITIFMQIGDPAAEAEMVLDLAYAYTRLNKPEEAAAQLRRFLDLQPDDVDAREQYIQTVLQFGAEESLVDDYLCLIHSYTGLNQPERALHHLERYLSIEQQNLEMLELQIRLLNETGQREQALEKLINLCELHRRNGRHKHAIQLLADALKGSPQNARLHTLMGNVYVEMNFKGRGLESFKHAAELHQSLSNWDELELAYHAILQIDPQEKEIREKLIQLQLKNGKTADAVANYLEQAEHFISREMPDLAEEQFRNVLEIQPDNVEVMRKLILLHEQLGCEDELVHDYTALSNLLCARGLMEDAVRIQRELVRLEPKNVQARRKLIDMFLEFGDERDIIDDYLILGAVLIEVGQLNEAANVYRHMLTFDPENEQARASLRQLAPGEVAEETIARPLNSSADSAVKAISPDDRVQTKVEKRGKSGTDANGNDSSKLTKAIQNYEILLAKQPDNPEARERLGDCYQQLNEINAAVEQWDLACQSYEKRRQHIRVIELCKKILYLRPNMKSVRDRLSNAQLQSDVYRAVDSAIDSIHNSSFFGQTDFDK